MTVAFIPARGGSKGIPKKNIKYFCGKPLIFWSLLAAQKANCIDKVYVSTDCQEIKATVNRFGFSKVEVIDRPASLAGDATSTESVLLDFAKDQSFDDIVLIQATSPLLKHTDLENGMEKYRGGYDSLLSVVKQKRFVWDDNESGAEPANYDADNRPRRQDFRGFWVENGAFYITSREKLLAAKNRISGKIGLYEMPEYAYAELDEPADWKPLEALAKGVKAFYLSEWVKHIKVVILDVDGTLTDGGVLYTNDGETPAKFSRVDGKGIELAFEQGMDIWVLSSEDNDIIKQRCEKLKIKNVFLGVKDKMPFLSQQIKTAGLSLKEAAFVGDDVQDIGVMQEVGFGAAPSNAVDAVKAVALYECCRSGGNGAVREVLDLIMQQRNV